MESVESGCALALEKKNVSSWKAFFCYYRPSSSTAIVEGGGRRGPRRRKRVGKESEDGGSEDASCTPGSQKQNNGLESLSLFPLAFPFSLCSLSVALVE